MLCFGNLVPYVVRNTFDMLRLQIAGQINDCGPKSNLIFVVIILTQKEDQSSPRSSRTMIAFAAMVATVIVDKIIKKYFSGRALPPYTVFSEIHVPQ